MQFKIKQPSNGRISIILKLSFCVQLTQFQIISVKVSVMSKYTDDDKRDVLV